MVYEEKKKLVFGPSGSVYFAETKRDCDGDADGDDSRVGEGGKSSGGGDTENSARYDGGVFLN